MKTLFVGRNIIHLNSVDSTNKYADGLLRQSELFEGSVIVAEEQQQGKGQRGAHWFSEEGKNLTFTIIFYPTFIQPDEQFLLSKAIALGVLDFVQANTLRSVKVKWPNDIYIDAKKVAGILIENAIRGNKINYSVVGIGININQTLFPGLSNVTSLQLIEERTYDLKDCLEDVCSTVEATFLALRANKRALDETYLAHLYRYNEWGEYIYEGKLVNGCIRGVVTSGKLILELEGGRVVYCDIKELVFKH